MRRFSPAWTALPVDDLSIPVAGFTCLGLTERKAMSYELLSGFGIDEFPDVTAARAAAAAAPKQTATTPIKAPATVSAPTTAKLSTSILSRLMPKVTTLPAPARVTSTSPLMPSLSDMTMGTRDGATLNSTPGQCPEGYVMTASGCADPLAYVAPAPVDNTKTLLMAGGLVVAIGVSAFLLTRKGK